MSTALETLEYRAPLALRCADAGTGAAVADRLVATAWPAGDPRSARTARRSPVSQLLGFAVLPGLDRQLYARRAGPGPVDLPPPDPVAVLVLVLDGLDRYPRSCGRPSRRTMSST